MKKLIFFATIVLFTVPGATYAKYSKQAVVLTINGAIGPATADYIERGIHAAERHNASLVVIKMDTPGGLDTSMRQIIKRILTSKIPVVTYVSPSGARAASAGTYILYASHVAAMAPGTNLGAATPVPIGGGDDKPEAPSPMPNGKKEKNSKKDKTDNGGEGKEKTNGKQGKAYPQNAMKKKIINDSIAYIRGLAQMRKRNADWAEKAVLEAASLSTQEAVKLNVVDLSADNMQDLMRKIDKRKVKMAYGEAVIDSEELSFRQLDPDWRSELLSIITNPSLIPILMMLGTFGLLYELYNPGFVLPGVIGGICLLLALYATQVLPINYAGLALIGLGIMFMVAEAFVPSFGALGIGGIISFVAGSIMLMDTDVEGYTVSWPLITFVAVAGAGTIALVLTFVKKAHNRAVVSGQETMVGREAEALETFDHKGTIRISGEIWSAVTDTPVSQGQTVIIERLQGLTAYIRPARAQENMEE